MGQQAMHTMLEPQTNRFNLTFIAEASQILGRTLDPAATAAEVVRLQIPLIADRCSVDLIDQGAWWRAASSHVDDATSQHLRSQAPPSWHRHLPAELDAFLAIGEPLCLGDASLVNVQSASERRLLSVLAGMDLGEGTSAMAVPLVVGGRAYGVMTLACDVSGRQFNNEDLALGLDIARRAAVAIANARLFVEAEKARSEAEKARQRSQFLSRVSDVLASAVLLDDALRETARLAISEISDVCVVDFSCRDDGHAFAVAHTDATRERALNELFEADPNALEQLRRLPRRQHAARNTEPTAPRAIGCLSALLRPSASLTLPLWVRGVLRGHVTFVRCGESANFAPDDVTLSEELLRRASGAIDRAWLFKELGLAIRVRDEFLSIASHELRTPLTALELQLGNLHRLLNKCDPSGLKERFLDKVGRATRQTDRLGKLIDNLLDVSRISAGRFCLEPEPMHLETLCADLAERWADEAEAAGCPFHLSIGCEIEGSWDPMRLEQVLVNLLSNAIKYGAGHPIELHLTAELNDVVITVRDHGIGVEQKALQRIFDCFERAVSPREFGGLGLGLFISREIVHAHGGQIFVRSEVGHGAEFEVRLPYETAIAPASNDLHPMLGTEALRGLGSQASAI